MKRLIILFLFLSHISFGQTSYGVKGGFGDAWFRSTYSTIYSAPRAILPAYSLGGYLNYSLGNFSIQHELFFSHKGAAFLFPVTNSNNDPLPGKAKNSTNLNYLEIPISLYYSFKEKENTAYFGMGLAPSILLTARQRNKYLTNVWVRNIRSQLNAFDLGYIITVGYKKNRFFAEARLNIGLRRVFPIISYTNQSIQNININIRNNVFMILVGMKLSK
jgi:hypothetical protein